MNFKDLIKGKKLLIFDFDGTLADTSPLHCEAFTQVLAPLGINCDYRLIAGMKTLDAIRKCFSLAGIENPSTSLMLSLAKSKQIIVRNLIVSELKPLPGINQLIDTVSATHQLAIVSSGSRATVSLALSRLHFKAQFSILICADDVTNSKPSPDGFLYALGLSGFEKSEALIFEDSHVGFQAARNAEIDFVDIRTAVTHFTPRISG
jgi:HAD superfamily hydrolase (TIGR01509 family)